MGGKDRQGGGKEYRRDGPKEGFRARKKNPPNAGKGKNFDNHGSSATSTVRGKGDHKPEIFSSKTEKKEIGGKTKKTECFWKGIFFQNKGPEQFKEKEQKSKGTIMEGTGRRSIQQD